MILEQETYEKYGYYPSKLSKGSHRLILIKCDRCGRIIEKIIHGLHKQQKHHFCSKNCHDKWQIKKVKYECKYCGKEFEDKPSAERKFCSKDCSDEYLKGERSIHRKEKIKCVCKWCGKEFEVRPSAITANRGVFCSKECYGKWQSENKTGRNNPSYRGGKVKCICPQCGREFEVYPHRFKNYGVLCCSSKCMGEWNSENRVGNNSAHWKGGKVERICEECGNNFEVFPKELKNNGGRFCSIQCQGRWQSKNRTGETSANWQGGISFEPYCIKFNNEFKERVREFFGRRCFECNKTEEENGVKLSVHHVNYDKMVCCNDVIPLFAALCRGCNSKVNGNRKYWEEHFTQKIMKEFKGKCFYTKEEMKELKKT